MAESSSVALLNHLVLEKILKYLLDVPDLKSFRLVCNIWNEVGTSFLAQKVNLVLEDEGMDELLHSISAANSHSVAKFSNITIKINSSQSISTTISDLWSSIHLNIKSLELHVTTFYARNELEYLLMYHLPSLTVLKLVITKYWAGANSIRGDQFKCTALNSDVVSAESVECNKNLKFFQLSYIGSLAMDSFPDDDDDDANDIRFPVNWKIFFKRYPELHHIGVNTLNNMDICNMLNAWSQHELETESPVGSTIVRSLEILDENIFPQIPNDEHLELMSTLRNNFETLHLEISPFTTQSLLYALLNKCSSSLKVLRLRRYPHPYNDAPITLTGNCFKMIKFLEISEFLLSSLSFLPCMPSLERLHIILRDYSHITYCEMVENTTNPSRLAHSGVKYLYIEPPLISTECIEKLAVCLPELESLKLRVNNEMLREICRTAKQTDSSRWKKLKSLYLTSWDGLTNEGITGIEEQVFDFCGEDEVRRHRNKPYIGDIQGLQSLTIEMWSDCNNHISDWSVLYGVMEVDSLEKVTFVRCGISSSAFESITITNKFIIH